jgi:two-component system cell cycle sensor histidine kinase/response regulator CckA
VLGGRRGNPALARAEAVLFDAPPEKGPAVMRVKFEIDSAFQGREGLEKLTAALEAGLPYAMAFVDVRMPPGWDGIETIEALWKVCPALQVVLCTAHSDYSWEKMTARLGLNENLLILKKPFDNIEVLQLAHALTKKWQLTEQAGFQLETLESMVHERTSDLQRVNAELSRSEERFSKAFRSSPVPVAIQTLGDGRFVDVNDAFARMTGFGRSAMAGRTLLELRLCIHYEPPFEEGASRHAAVENLHAQICTSSGEQREVLVSHEPIVLAGEPHRLVMMQDITERLRIENQLRQAQKMEAIGQLAAGVAHDFNNLLTIIEGHASLQLAGNGSSEGARESFGQIEMAAERAAELTRKLLTFSRRQIMRPKVLDLNTLVREVTSMLRRLIGVEITVCCLLLETLPAIFADQTNIEQIIMNLALNARDAMPKGGTITIVTECVDLTEETCGNEPGARPGRFVCLRVSDTGTGMDEATRLRIFEPFFTTKDIDKGTGMGLATVYGVVKQHEGWIEVDSAPGKGATFRVILPVTDKIAESKTPIIPTPIESAGPKKRTLLVVEDDSAVRSVVEVILSSVGYRVIEAANAAQALELWKRFRDEIDLILTDMVMPGSANGLELAALLRAERPDLKVIFTSGYSSDLFTSELTLQEGVNYLPKPYLSSKLIAILRQAFEPAMESAALS